MAEKKVRPVDGMAGDGSLLFKLLGIRKKKNKRLQEIEKDLKKGSQAALQIKKSS